MWDDTTRQIKTSESLHMAIGIGIGGAAATFVITLVIARAIDGLILPEPTNLIDAIFAWAFTRAHLVFAAVGFFVVGERVVATILHDRNQLHRQDDERLDVFLEREREETRRMRLQNDIAALNVKALQGKSPDELRGLLIGTRSSSAWSLTVVKNGNRHELDGRLIEAYARGLRSGEKDLREYIRREGVSFGNDKYAVLRMLMDWAGIETTRGFDEHRLNDNLDLWRTTHIVEMADAPRINA